MNRVHRVNVASVCERLAEERVQAVYCSTKLQRANGFTKVISPQEWPLVLSQLCLLPATGNALANTAQDLSADALVLAAQILVRLRASCLAALESNTFCIC